MRIWKLYGSLLHQLDGARLSSYTSTGTCRSRCRCDAKKPPEEKRIVVEGGETRDRIDIRYQDADDKRTCIAPRQESTNQQYLTQIASQVTESACGMDGDVTYATLHW